VYDLEIRNAVVSDTCGCGAVAYFCYGGERIMTRVRVQDAAYLTTRACKAGVAYLYASSFTAEDGVINGFTYDPGNSSTMRALLYGRSTDMDMSGMEISESQTLDISQNQFTGYGYGYAYTDPSNGDFSLASGSPMNDAGDPDILDADGSVSDVGAYGEPYGASW
jgi:hypothetical protein